MTDLKRGSSASRPVAMSGGSLARFAVAAILLLDGSLDKQGITTGQVLRILTSLSSRERSEGTESRPKPVYIRQNVSSLYAQDKGETCF